METKNVLLETKKVKKHFSLGRGVNLKAVEDVTFTIDEGEKFGVVGESGCGKSTLGRVILQLYEQTSGATIYYGKPIEELSPKYVDKEIEDIKGYQKRAKEAYAKAVAFDIKLEDFKKNGQADCEEAKKVKKASKEAKKEASRELREGSRTVGSLILIENLDKVVELFKQSQLHAKKVHEAIEAYKKLEYKHANCVQEKIDKKETAIALQDAKNKNASAKEIKALEKAMKKLTHSDDEIDREIDTLKTQMETTRKTAQEYKEKAQNCRKEAFDMRGKDVLPITERTLEKEYQDKMDRNYENGINLAKLTNAEMRVMRRDMQMIFQDPAASLDPRQSIGNAIAEVYAINTDYSPTVRKEKTMELLEKVGLKREHYYSYPNALSGGQKQRVGIARAIAMETKFIVLDEAVSALDVSVQAQILQLLNNLSEEKHLTYFFITHDLGVVKHFCDRIMVMYLGNVCELATSDELFHNTLHPYTKSLLASVPRARLHKEDENDFVLQGEVPSAVKPPKGCPFHTRCDQCMDICKKEKPVYQEVKVGHFVACHLFKAQEEEEL